MENEPKSKTSFLEIKPLSIDYGCLSPGQQATAMLNVSGGPGKVSFSSSQLSVSPTSFECGDQKLEITLMGGVFGELIWEEIILETDTQEIRVPITARWIKITTPASISENSESLVPKHKEGTQTSEEHRTFKGKSCSLCGRNFSYYSNSGTWEQCKCNWYQMAINIGKRIIIDLRSGAKEIPSYLEETWRMVLGKEKL